jgi:serine/threonine protein kinase
MSLQGLLSKGIWYSEESQKEWSEFYSLPKYLFYLYKTLETLSYAHSYGIIIGSLTPKDIMIDKTTQKVTIRNFAYSTLTK